MSDAEQGKNRRQSLNMYLAVIEEQLKQSVGASTLSFTTPQGAVEIDSWTTQIIRSAMQATPETEPERFALLVSDAVAFKLRTADCCSKGSEFSREFATELRRDIELGSDLAASLQLEINQLVAGVQLDEAKKVGQLRHGLRDDVRTLGKILREGQPPPPTEKKKPEEENKSNMFRMDTGVFDDPALKQKQRRAAEEKRRKKLMEENRKRRRAEARKKAFLYGSFVALILAWILTVFIPWMLDDPIKVISAQEFSSIPTITTIDAKPPSVFVTVDSSLWNRLDDDGKLDVIRSIGTVLAPTRYTGAWVTDENSVGVGSWLREKGSTVIKPPPETADGKGT